MAILEEGRIPKGMTEWKPEEEDGEGTKEDMDSLCTRGCEY